MGEQHTTLQEFVTLLLFLGAPVFLLMGAIYYRLTQSALVSLLLLIITFVVSAAVWLYFPLTELMFHLIHVPSLIAGAIVTALFLTYKSLRRIKN